MSLISTSSKIRKWVLVIDFLYGSDLESTLNYSFNGAGLLLSKGLKVRAGSVIFLVGVGSLVCWKIWDYWNSGDDGGASCESQFQSSPPPKSPSKKKNAKTPTRSAKEFFASFLEEEFVHDFNELEDEDPALIQGKYFGPDSPTENKLKFPKRPEDRLPDATGEQSPITSQTDSGRQDLEDTSGAYLADDDGGSGTSDFEEDSLPYDGVSSVDSNARKVRKRHHPRSERNNDSVISRMKSLNKNLCDMASDTHLSPSKSLHSKLESLKGENEISSSETSPREHHFQQEMFSQRRQSRSKLSKNRRAEFGISENGETDSQRFQRSHSANKPYFYTSLNSDDETPNDERLQVEYDREISPRSPRMRRSLSRDISLNDLMGRLRQRSGQRAPLSRDNSVSSRMSDFLRRDDSICSNLSDFAFSECSEISLEFSIKDDSIADQTIISFADIEDELNTLKSSVLEIDEEFLKFASKPNPYLLKTTFTDYSYESSESRPGSSLDLITYRRRSRSRSKSMSEDFSAIKQDLEHSSPVVSDAVDDSSKEPERLGDKELKRARLHSPHMKESVSFGSPQHEWTPSKRIRIQRRRSSIEAALKFSTQDEIMPSLEWDNGCFRQYEEERGIPEETNDFEMQENQIESHKFLPDHCSLELDLEKELQYPFDSHPTFSGKEIFASPLNDDLNPGFNPCKISPKKDCDSHHLEKESYPSKRPLPSTLSLESDSTIQNNMTTSVDSAIQSAPGSRSGSVSPVPHSMTQSMMSSGIGASWSEAFEGLQESEGPKSRKFWGTEESGYIEGEDSLTASTLGLSPVQEVREYDNSSESIFNNNNNNNNNSQALESEGEAISNNEINGNTPDNNNLSIMGNNGSSLNGESPATSFSTHSVPLAVGDKLDILSYAESEWQGKTSKAQTIRKGYSAIPVELNLHNIRRIRGDNYCGIRAVLYQVLVSGLPLPNGYQVYNRLVSEVNKGAHWLKEYSFGRRLSYSKDQTLFGFKECLDSLDKLQLDLVGCENKECVLVSRLNNDPQLDIKLCEAAKLHMLACALDLYKKEVEGGHIPLFGMIMYARQSCLNPRDFMINHLNAVGDSAGLEQIEMFLLGHSLRLTLQVVRPSCYGSEDFICFYPDENIGMWPEVNLVAEDDRHYNVLVK